MLVDGSEIGQRSETVRRANLSAIVRGLHERGPLSRSELVAATGLTRSAIRSLVGELAAAGFVIEEGAVRLGTPGRPSPLVRPNPASAAVLSLEILVDSIAAAIVGLGGVTSEHVRVDRPRVELSVDDVVTDLARIVAGLRSRDDTPIVGIGVAVAGVVRRSDGLVSMGPNLGWVDVPLGDHLARSLGVDAPITRLQRRRRGRPRRAPAGRRRRASTTCCSSRARSASAAVLIVDGRQLTGAAGYGGEVGHLPVNPDGAPCRCGSTGCWETEVGEGVLLRAGRPPGRRRLGGRRRGPAGGRCGRPGGPRGPRARRALAGHRPRGPREHPQPPLIILGGLHGRIHPYVARRGRGGARPGAPCRRPVRSCRVVPATLGVDAPLVGAAELAFEPLLADPAAWFGRRGRVFHLASA